MNGVMLSTLIELPLLIRLLCFAVLAGGAVDLLFSRRRSRVQNPVTERRTRKAVPKGCEAEVQLIRTLFAQLMQGEAVGVSARDEGLLALERIQHRLVGIRREDVTRQQQQGLELTKSEREVMKLMREGYSPQRIAAILGCSLSRVYKARSGLRKKLDIPLSASLGDYLRSMPD